MHIFLIITIPENVSPLTWINVLAELLGFILELNKLSR